MKKIVFSLMTMFIFLSSFAQSNMQNEMKPAIAEGTQIYKVEMANWVSPKIFSSQYKGKEKIAGNISYTEGDIVKSVFYSKGDKPKVLGSIIFDSTYDKKTAQVDLTERTPSSLETDLIKLQDIALKTIEDATFFTAAANAQFDVIPLISNGAKKVFVRSITAKNDAAIFGSDYVLSFDNSFKLSDKKRLHKNTVSIPIGDASAIDYKRDGTHTHVAETGELLTSTDFATLFLYEKITRWTVQSFISENYIFVWNCESHELQVIPKTIPKK